MDPAIRELFPIFKKNPGFIYLDSAATTHKPDAVISELSHFYREEYATVHRAIYHKSLAATEKYNDTRRTVQRFLNAAQVEEIVFTRGTTDGINLVAASLSASFLPGDEILLSETEHHSNIVPWQMAAQRTGATIRWIPVDDRGVLDLKAFRLLLNEKTKLVAIAHVSNVTGTIHPIREIASIAQKAGAKILVDGAQAAPHLPVDVQHLGVDFYVFSGHKCYGPTGVGALYGKIKWLEEMPPVQGGGDMVDRVDFDKSTYQPPPLKFEAGTPLIAPVIALKPALDLLMQIGLDKVAAWEHELYLCAIDRLKGLSGFKIIGNAPSKGALLTFVVEGVHPLDIATLLDLKQIAIRSGHLCAQTSLRRFGLETAARASFGLYNTLEEAEKFGNVLKSSISLLTEACSASH